MLIGLALYLSTGVLADIAIHRATDLVAAAAATGRPPECMPTKPGAHQQSEVWSRARHPNLERYCAQIARAHARLEDELEVALTAAKRADELVPQRAAPFVIMGRVALRRSNIEEASKAFATALSRDPRAVEQPVAMHDFALTQWRAGQIQEALATFRVLVPRASLMPDRQARARVLLEAAHVAMGAAATDSAATLRILDESLAYLREASRDSHHPFERDVAMSLVLALDRAGQRAQADAVLEEQRQSRAWINTATLDYLATPDDALVLRGLALERHDPSEAAKSYNLYLASPSGNGIYGSAVRARLATLSASPPRTTPSRRGR